MCEACQPVSKCFMKVGESEVAHDGEGECGADGLQWSRCMSCSLSSTRLHCFCPAMAAEEQGRAGVKICPLRRFCLRWRHACVAGLEAWLHVICS